MHVEPWSQTPEADMAQLYAAEARRWRDHLSWDYADTGRQLEHVRTQRLVPGLVARDDAGAPCGWTFFVRVGPELQIGALTAQSPEIARALLGHVLTSPEAAGAGRAVFFGFVDAPGIEAELRTAGFAVGTYRYLARPLTPNDAEDGAAARQRPWQDGDLTAAAGLLREAYAEPDPLRPFGGAGQPADWFAYTQRLIVTAGCGVFEPALSVVRPGVTSVEAMTIVTRVAPDTVHLAQVAVRAASRGQGLAAGMIRRSLAAAAGAGFVRMTLLVSETNPSALRLYARLGFTARATFVSASRGPSA